MSAGALGEKATTSPAFCALLWLGSPLQCKHFLASHVSRIDFSKGSTLPSCLYRHQKSHLADASSACTYGASKYTVLHEECLGCFHSHCIWTHLETYHLLSTLHFPNEVLTAKLGSAPIRNPTRSLWAVGREELRDQGLLAADGKKLRLLGVII